MNVLPLPGVLDQADLAAQQARQISRLIARPRPVPPYLRLVLPSACWNASKMICCLSGGMPMPVSRHREGQHRRGPVQLLVLGVPAAVDRLDRQRDLALLGELEGVGQQVLEDLLQPLGVGEDRLAAGRGSSSMAKSTLFDSATWRKVRST